jgi:hypothetical protein
MILRRSRALSRSRGVPAAQNHVFLRPGRRFGFGRPLNSPPAFRPPRRCQDEAERHVASLAAGDTTLDHRLVCPRSSSHPPRRPSASRRSGLSW